MSTRQITIHIPTPYRLQAEIISYPARYKIVATGRRIGKTTLGTLRTSRIALDYPGVTCWWVAPVTKAMNLAWERFKVMLGPIAEISETNKRLTLPNGSQIWCVSAHEPENLRGEGVDDLTLDEAAYVKKLDYVWYGVLRPMLIDSGGSMLALSTPNRRNLFYQWYLRGKDDLDTEWQSWEAPTMANPFLPAKEFDELLQEYPPDSELYKQEILGQFLESGGQVFRKVREAATATKQPDYMGGVDYIGGIDWGKSQDFTVAIVMRADTRQMVAMERFNIVDYTMQRDRIKALSERWNVKHWIAESNAMGEPNLEMLRRDDLKVMAFATTAQSKRPLIEGLAQAFELGRIGIWEDSVLIGELESYERKTSASTGASTYSAPQGGHDDCVMALALAWHGVQGPYTVTVAEAPDEFGDYRG